MMNCMKLYQYTQFELQTSQKGEKDVVIEIKKLH